MLSETEIYKKEFINPELISLLIFIISGYLMGVSHTKPILWFFAWLGIGLIPFALKFSSKKSLLFLGFIIHGFIYETSAHTWYFSSVAGSTNDKYSLINVVLLSSAIILTMSVPRQLPMFFGSVFRTKIKLPLFVWFPFIFILGEYITLHFSGISVTALLYSQWQVQPVLRALGNMGWYPTLFFIILIPLVFSESVIYKSKKYFSVFVISTLVIVFQPKLNSDIPDILYEVGSVYLDRSFFKPTKVPENIKLLIWPEVTRTGRPRIEEGLIYDVMSKAPIEAKNTFHLIGQETRVKDGLQNSALIISPYGNVIASRSKSKLFPGFETPFFGIQFKYGVPYIAGEIPPYLEVNGMKILVLICFEQIYHGFVKKHLQPDTDLIVVIASDQLMGRNQEVFDQFTGITATLAAETGLPVVRSSRIGPSVIIAPNGRVLKSNKVSDNTGILSLGKK